MSTLRWGGQTDVGLVREVNQDSFLTAMPLFAVADGMGGHRGGEVASATALEILESTFGDSDTMSGLLEAARRANAKVWDKAQLDDDLRGMGTTLTAIAKVIDEDTGKEQVAIVNVGDSRTYLMREGEMRQLTEDHSFVEEMVRAGEISAEEAEVHPKRNIVTRALGVEPTVEVDSWAIDAQEGDRILMCSDGLTREVSDGQISAVLRRLRNPEEAVRELVKMARAGGGHDNITVVIVDVVPDDAASLEGAGASGSKNKPKKSKKSKSKRRSPLTFRTLLFVLAMGALVGVAIGSVVWYARSSHFVGLEGEQLVIYRGRPEPVLWFEPTISERTNVTRADVLPSAYAPLSNGVTQESREAAYRYIDNLVQEADAAREAAGENPDESANEETNPDDPTNGTSTTVPANSQP